MEARVRRHSPWRSACIAVLAIAAAACGPSDGSTGARRHTFYQVSTLGALTIGLYEEATTVGELLEHGDFGLGTFEALDGEMIVLDGQAYRVGTDGLPMVVDGNRTTPFAAVANFAPDQILSFRGPLEYSALQQAIDDELTTLNVPVAIRIQGIHSFVLARSVPKQSEPFPPLADVVAMQTKFALTDVAGTLVGFRTPEYFGDLNATGYHFHFLSDDRQSGGHVLDGLLDAVEVEVQYMRDFRMELPDNAAFDEAVLTQ